MWSKRSSTTRYPTATMLIVQVEIFPNSLLLLLNQISSTSTKPATSSRSASSSTSTISSSSTGNLSRKSSTCMRWTSKSELSLLPRLLGKLLFNVASSFAGKRLSSFGVNERKQRPNRPPLPAPIRLTARTTLRWTTRTESRTTWAF